MKSNPLSRILTHAACLAAGVFWASANADDIDLYSSPISASDLPNVIILLDNSANWSATLTAPNCYYKEGGVATTVGPKATAPNKEQGTKMGVEKCALYNVVDALPTTDTGAAMFNIGIMLFNESPASNAGGYPRIAMQPLTATFKSTLKAAIKNLSISADKGNNAAFGEALYETYLYLKSAAPYMGTAGNEWDTTATVGGSRTGNYLPPSPNSCGKNHVIFIANGAPGENTDADVLALLRNVSADTTQITFPTSYVSNSDQANWSDELARFMYNKADVSTKDLQQSIQVHAVAVTGATSDGLYPNFMDSIARQGGTASALRAQDADSLTAELLKIFAEIQSVSGVFASASLPISVNARGTYLNQIFMGTFLPAQGALPRWDGNLKQYQFVYNQALNTLALADRNGVPAVDSSSGFIKATATSFWTHDSKFWTNQPLGSPASISDLPDGNVIPKGAAAQILRDNFMHSQAARKVYTCVTCSPGTDLTSSSTYLFEDANTLITTTMLGLTATDAAQRTAIINWARGENNAPATITSGTTTFPNPGYEKPGVDDNGVVASIRPSVHGDVLHSRPVAINYSGTTGVVAFYGSNDGFLHAVNGAQTGADAGKTLWSFAPAEHFNKFKRVRDGYPLVNFPGVPASAPRGYFVDGPISSYVQYDTSGILTKAWIFVAMRRGGRFLYAFDVTDPTKPIFKWKISAATTGFSRLGQTWSEAKVTRIKGVSEPVIVMGGGYDNLGEDTATPSAIPVMGNVVYVLKAFTGELLRAFTLPATGRAIPADVTLVDSDFDTYVDRAYAVDLGGAIYRIDFEPNSNTGPTDWTLTTLATLGASGGKKFFFSPDVVVTNQYTAVLVGSGDREKPLLNATTEYFYTVLDKTVGKTMTMPFTPIVFTDLKDIASFNISSDAGCYLPMSTAGEKVVNSPLTVGGITHFSTNKPIPPSPNACNSNLGQAQEYNFPLVCQAPEVITLNGGGLPPSPVAGTVTVKYIDENGVESERQVNFCIGCGDNKSAIEGGNVKFTVAPRRKRIYAFPENAQ